MYLIPKSIYENELSFMTEGKPNFFEIEQLIPFATKYIIEAGDLFYMPHGYYHVGRNIGFSKSVTIWLEDLTEEKLIDRLVLYLSSQIFKSEGNNVIPSDRSSIASTSFLYSRIKHLIRNDEGVLKLSVKDLIQRCLKEYKYLIASNNSYVPRPLRESGNSTSKVEWTEIVQVNSKYKLLVSTNQKVLKVFWMGTSFSLPNSYSVRKIVRLIQKGGSIKTQDLIATLHKDFDSESSLEIINVLVKKKILLSR
jgi:hypothetical protein